MKALLLNLRTWKRLSGSGADLFSIHPSIIHRPLTGSQRLVSLNLILTVSCQKLCLDLDARRFIKTLGRPN